MKKLLFAIWIFLAAFFICLIINHVKNEKLISDYESGVYEENEFTAFGFFEPYIAHYNQGNIEYQNGNYDKAIEEYEAAIEGGITDERDCLARINIALSMIAPINLDEINDENIDDIIAKLEEAKKVLTENGCAHEEDRNGHNDDAQQLKEDIDEFIRKLKEQKNNGGGGDDHDPDNPDPDNPKEEPIDGENEKRKQLEQLRGQGQKERGQNIIDPEEQNRLFEDYYDGPTW